MSSDSPTLAVPGVVHVQASGAAGSVVTTGPAAGWISLNGIREWSQELSLIARKDLTDAIREELSITLPENRIAKSRHPHAYRAAETATLLGVVSDIAPKLVEKGVRVHTVGYDRVTGGFIYFAEGGKDEPLRVHGDLLEMIAPALEGGSSNADIERYLERFIDRVLIHFSKGSVTESAVELANALPRLATDAKGLTGVDLDAFEAEAAANADKSKPHEANAKKLADALASANGGNAVAVPLFGEAKAQTQPAMEIVVDGASVTLPARTLWTVSGAIREEARPKVEEAKPKVEEARPKVVEKTPASAPVSKPVVEKAVASPKPAPVIQKAAASPKPAPVIEKVAASPKPAPVVTPPASKPVVEKVAPAPASISKPVATPSPAPASAKPKAERLPTPAPGKIPGMFAAKPAEKAPVSAPRPESTPKPEKAEPAVQVLKPVAVVGVGEAPVSAKAPEKKPAKPEVVAEAKPKALQKELEAQPTIEAPAEPAQLSKTKQKAEARRAAEEERKAEERAKPKPAKSERPAAAKAIEKDEPEKKKAAASEPAPAPPTSNTMLYVIIALLIVAAIAFFLMKKK